MSGQTRRSQKFILVVAAASAINVDATRVDCAALCQNVPACRSDPHGHGSYCKTDNTPEVCFGMLSVSVYKGKSFNRSVFH